MYLRTLCIGALVAAVGCKSPPRAQEPPPDQTPSDPEPVLEPRITTVVVPEQIQLAADFAEYRERLPGLTGAVVVTVLGEDMRSDSMEPLLLQVLDAEERVMRAQFTAPLPAWKIAAGVGETALLLFDSGMSPGRYQLCASLPPDVPRVCAPLSWQDDTDECAKAFLKALDENPTFGCRCKKGGVITDPTKIPTKNLGSFTNAVGGNTLGPYNNGAPNQETLTSVVKFEASFEIETVNEPERPDECGEEMWQTFISGFLCQEGQALNGELVFKAGTQTEHKEVERPVGGAPGVLFPYTPNTEDPTKFMSYGGGYKVPFTSAGKSISGRAKAYDFPIIHWISAPGVVESKAALYKRVLPMHHMHRFHLWVHGSSNTDEDNCDCFMDLKTAVVDANGVAQDSQVIAAPVCK